MRVRLLSVSLAFATGFGVGSGVVRSQDPELRFGVAVPREVDVIYERGLTWLAANQSNNGAWEGATTGYTGSSGNTGITGMCVMAFLASGEDPNFGPWSENIRRAVRSMIRSQDPKTGYLPGSMYHHGFAMLGLAEVYGVLDEESLWQGDSETGRQRSIGEALELAVRCSVTRRRTTSGEAGGIRRDPMMRIHPYPERC